MRNGVTVSDEDPSRVALIGINIRKQAEGPDSRTFASGSPVPFEIAVTNTGDRVLTNVVVTDAAFPGCGNDIGDLAIGQTVTYSCTVPNVTDSFTNEACVTGSRAGVRSAIATRRMLRSSTSTFASRRKGRIARP